MARATANSRPRVIKAWTPAGSAVIGRGDNPMETSSTPADVDDGAVRAATSTSGGAGTYKLASEGAINAEGS